MADIDVGATMKAGLMAFLNRLKILLSGDVPPADPADLDIARRAYADYLRAQLIGLVPDKAAALMHELAPPTDSEGNAKSFETLAQADFATLMGIETRLTEMMDDDQIERHYWIVRDRLNRVGSPLGIREHDVWAPVAAMRDHGAFPTELDTARRAKAAALAMVGETTLALAAREAELVAAGDAATDTQRAAVEAARTAVTTATTAAKEATERVIALEAQQADPAKTPDGRDPDANLPRAAEAADGDEQPDEGDEAEGEGEGGGEEAADGPVIDRRTMDDAAAASEAEARLAQQVSIAAEDARSLEEESDGSEGERPAEDATGDGDARHRETE